MRDTELGHNNHVEDFFSPKDRTTGVKHHNYMGGRETDGNNEICLGVRFALCIIKSSTTRSY